MAPIPTIPVVAQSVESATAVHPDAKAAGTYRTSPLDRRGYGAALILLEAGVLGSSATVDCKLQEADAATQGGILNNLLDDQDTGLPLRYDTADNVELAISFTTPNNDGVTPRSVHAMFKAVGTLAASKNVTMTIQADSSDAPDDTDLFTPVNGDKAPDEIGTSEYEVVKFAVPDDIHLAANTKYWIVFEGDWTLSTSNHLLLGIDTVVSGGNIQIHDADWGSEVATQVGLVDIQGHDWTDITGAAFTQLTQAGGDSSKTVLAQVNLKPRKAFLRKELTVATATSDVASRIMLMEPNVRPGGSALDFDV